MPEKQSNSPWIDISIPLQNGMVHWPSDPAFERIMVSEIAKGDSANLSRLSLGSHTGTHIDAPIHFLKDGRDISSMPVDIMIGPARVIEINTERSITAEDLVAHKIRRNERLLIKTRNSQGIWKNNSFVTNFVSLSLEAADYLACLQIKMLGVDYLSVGPYHGNGGDIHRKLLVNDIWIIEGLDLARVDAGRYFLICLPLKIVSGDGSPARAVLKKLPGLTSTDDNRKN